MSTPRGLGTLTLAWLAAAGLRHPFDECTQCGERWISQGLDKANASRIQEARRRFARQRPDLT